MPIGLKMQILTMNSFTLLHKMENNSGLNKIAKAITYVFFPGNMGMLGLFSMSVLMLDRLWGFTFLVVVPLLMLGLLLHFGKIGELNIHKPQQRILPLAFTLLFALTYYALAQHTWVKIFALAYAATVAVGLLCNILDFKISIHGMGVGSYLGLVVVLQLSSILLVAAILLLIAVYWARLQLKAHSHFQLICGVLVGFLLTFVFYFYGL